MKKEFGYWNNKQNCIEEAKKYSTKKDFRKKSHGAYCSIVRNGWLDEICVNLIGRKKGIKRTYEECLEEAKKYDTITEFYKNERKIYNYCHKKNWLKDINKFLKTSRKPNGYWNKERCIFEAKKYETRNDYRINSNSSYNSSKRNGWLNDVCSHMKHKETKSKNYWTKEKCKEEACKYKTKNEFKIKSCGAYNATIKNKWLDEICFHMMEGKKSNGYWNNKKRCLEEALKYTKKSEFDINSRGAYASAIRNGWLDEICSHMEIVGHKYKRLIYIYEFPDNHVYVGLTGNIKIRKNQHIDNENSPIYKHNKKTGLIPQLTYSEYINVLDAIRIEGEKVEKYKSDGWIILNTAKTGGLGACHIFLTQEVCHEEALKYKTRGEFIKSANSIYVSAIKYGFLEEICSHMIEVRKKPDYWTKELCQKESIKFERKVDFQNQSGAAYCAAKKQGWLNDICSHMKKDGRTGYKIWKKEECKQEYLKYNSLEEFKKSNPLAYQSAKRNKWLKDF